MKSVLKYPGAKNRIAPWIVKFIPDHDVYLEPFAGSLAVLFNKVPAKIETVNDLSGDVVNFFRILRDKPDHLIQKLSLTPYSREEYKRSYEIEEYDNVEKARKFCIRCWQGFGCGNLYRNGFKSGQQRNSPNPANAWDSLEETLIIAAKRLKKVQIENLPAADLIQRYNTSDVFIYADPPYPADVRKKYLYEFEMCSDDHIQLLNILIAHPGKVMLSGYENDLYDSYLSKWHKEYRITQAEGGAVRKEVLWMNYNPNIQVSIYDILQDTHT